MVESNQQEELEGLRRENRELLERLIECRKHLAREEMELVQVVLTLDNKSRFALRPGVDFDGVMAVIMNQLFSSVRLIARVAIPYITPGGYPDFLLMMNEAFRTPAEIRLLFRYPNQWSDRPIHERIHADLASEIGVEKVRIRYLGEEEKSGLHAKVIIKDDQEALVSSANWTGYSLSRNSEVGLLVRSRRATRMLSRWFDFSFENAASWQRVVAGWRSD